MILNNTNIPDSFPGFPSLVRPAGYVKVVPALPELSMPPKMTERVEALEARLTTLEPGLGDLQSAFRVMFTEWKQSLLQEVSKMLEKKTDEAHDDSSLEEESPQRKDKLEEFRMSTKKVELPMFDGSDAVGWITRADTYFEVQSTSKEVKIKLARLCMEAQTIH